MLTSLHPVIGSRATVRTCFERGNVWPMATSSDDLLPDFGALNEGLLTGRLVATDTGWRAVETLRAGDMVLTFDQGMQPLVDCSPAPLQHDPRGAEMDWGVFVPKGAIGNRRAITLLPSQLVLLDCAYAENRYGDPFILAPAALLVGYKNIARVQLSMDLLCYRLTFADEQVVHTDGSALLVCHIAPQAHRPGRHADYPRVTRAEAHAFQASLNAPVVGSAPWPCPAPFHAGRGAKA